MAKKFLTKEEVFVVKGYLSSDKAKVQPISNAKFIETQKHAEYVIALAEAAKDKDFKGKQADSFEDFRRDVINALSDKGVTYIKEPKKVETELSNQLKNEALAFIKYGEDLQTTDAINNYLQRYNVIKEFEEIGLFFEDEIEKIDKIYTIDEITKAAKAIIDLL